MGSTNWNIPGGRVTSSAADEHKTEAQLLGQKHGARSSGSLPKSVDCWLGVANGAYLGAAWALVLGAVVGVLSLVVPGMWIGGMPKNRDSIFVLSICVFLESMVGAWLFLSRPEDHTQLTGDPRKRCITPLAAATSIGVVGVFTVTVSSTERSWQLLLLGLLSFLIAAVLYLVFVVACAAADNRLRTHQPEENQSPQSEYAGAHQRARDAWLEEERALSGAILASKHEGHTQRETAELLEVSKSLVKKYWGSR